MRGDCSYRRSVWMDINERYDLRCACGQSNQKILETLPPCLRHPIFDSTAECAIYRNGNNGNGNGNGKKHHKK